MKFPRIEGAVKLTDFISPMLAESSSRPAFTDAKWLFEIKWDGYRAIAEINGKDQNRLYSRKGTSYTKAFPKVYNALNNLRMEAVIDGEIVVYDEHGKPSFQLLQNYSSRQKYAIQFQVFDILQLKGRNVCNLPLIERKELLRSILPEDPIIRYCDHVETEGEMLYEHVLKLDMEGIIAKKIASKYVTGARSKDWLKIKNKKSDEFIIIGFLHSDKMAFKSLVVAAFEDGALTYRGAVSGFTEVSMKQIHKLLLARASTHKPVEKHEKFDVPVTWVEPLYRCSVRYTEITADGILRHPVFEGLVRE